MVVVVRVEAVVVVEVVQVEVGVGVVEIVFSYATGGQINNLGFVLLSGWRQPLKPLVINRRSRSRCRYTGTEGPPACAELPMQMRLVDTRHAKFSDIKYFLRSFSP